ncbi:MAG: YIP1 family protein [Firmicutes bacterium]|nr:YIP1 family protein [Bacillota bacterium]
MRKVLRQVWALFDGVARRPLETYERIAVEPPVAGGLGLVGFLAVAAAAVYVAAGLAGGMGGPGPPAASRLALALVWWTLGVFGVYLAAGTAVWLAARALGSRASWTAVLTAWAASYAPTAVWFAGLVLAHALVRPSGLLDLGSLSPAAPLAFEAVFLAFSLAVFLWKLLCFYLTLRVVGGLDFRRIVVAAVILAPLALGYWALGASLGWFKVPLL